MFLWCGFQSQNESGYNVVKMVTTYHEHLPTHRLALEIWDGERSHN